MPRVVKASPAKAMPTFPPCRDHSATGECLDERVRRRAFRSAQFVVKRLNETRRNRSRAHQQPVIKMRV